MPFEHGMQWKNMCCALKSTCWCLFSMDRVYKCTTHPVSFVGSELSIALCVCMSEYFSVCVYTCLSGNWRCGPIWGVSEQAGVSHAGCSWFIANGIQSGSFFASKVSVPSHYGLANFGLMLFVSLWCVWVWQTVSVYKNKYECILLEGSWLVCYSVNQEYWTVVEKQLRIQRRPLSTSLHYHFFTCCFTLRQLPW